MKLFFSLLLITHLATNVVAEPTTDLTKSRHLLNRFAYGPRPNEAETLATKGQSGFDSWLENQLKPRPENSELQKKINSLSILTLSSEALYKKFPRKNSKQRTSESGKPQEILQQLVLKKLILATESENQMQEVLFDFWFNHFNVSFDKGQLKWLITAYERDNIRPHLFGTFKDMLMAVAKSPAMLFYLDNLRSRDQAINENYARELLELHTLGVDGGYTQKDIQESARILTGWGMNQKGEFKFAPKKHDSGEKIVLGQRYKGNGIAEGEKLIEFLADHPNTALNIATKLATKFIADKPSEKVIKDIAAVFTKSKGDLKQVYRAIYKHPDFWKSENQLNKIKTPLEYYVSSARTLGATISPSLEKFQQLNQFFVQSGQALYRCQPPTGFKATSEFWVSSGALINRINLSLKMANQKIPQVQFSEATLTKDFDKNKFKNSKQVLSLLNKTLFSETIKVKTIDQLSVQITETAAFKENEDQEIPFHYFPFSKIMGLMLSTPEMQRR